MKKEKLLELISQTESLLKSLQSALAEEESVNENPTQETPVESIEEEVEELPAPPKEVHIDTPKEEDNDAIIGCQILTKFYGFYSGQCRVLQLHKKYKDNSDKIDPKTGKLYTKLRIYPDSVILIAKAFDGKILGTRQVAWNALSEWQLELIKRGIETHAKSTDPHKNWKPKLITLDLD